MSFANDCQCILPIFLTNLGILLRVLSIPQTPSKQALLALLCQKIKLNFPTKFFFFRSLNTYPQLKKTTYYNLLKFYATKEMIKKNLKNLTGIC